MTCAILSPAGESKTKILNQIFKDERSRQISPHFELLEKFFLNIIIKKSEVQDFESNHLEEHQRVRGTHGYTLLERAILEHNI